MLWWLGGIVSYGWVGETVIFVSGRDSNRVLGSMFLGKKINLTENLQDDLNIFMFYLKYRQRNNQLTCIPTYCHIHYKTPYNGKINKVINLC